MPDVFLFADSGPDVGLGHLRRCLSLAEAFQAEGARCKVYTPAADAIDMAQAAGFETTKWDTDPMVQDGVFSVLDSYRIDIATQSRLHRRAAYSVVIDDLADRPLSADLIVNHNLFAADLAYHDVARDTELLLGPRYALIDPEFGTIGAQRSLEATGTPGILVSFGGTDDGRYAEPVAHTLLDTFRDLVVHAVISPLRQPTRSIEELERLYPRRLFVHHGADMTSLMKGCAMYIGGAGVSILEAAAAHLAIVAIEMANNHRLNGQALRAIGVNCLRSPDVSALLSAFIELQTSGFPHVPALDVIDGKGARRVARHILARERAAQHVTVDRIVR